MNSIRFDKRRKLECGFNLPKKNFPDLFEMSYLTQCKPGAVLAIDAGGTNFKSTLIDAGGSVLSGSLYQCPVCSSGSLEVILGTYAELIRHALSRGVPIRGIGVSTPCPFDYQRGISLMKHKFPQLFGIILKDSLLELLPELADSVLVPH